MIFNKLYQIAYNLPGEVLDLNDKQISFVYKKLIDWLSEAIQMIDGSFFNPANKNRYKDLIQERMGLFF